MKKRVLLLAVSCKKGGLCPGGVDLDDPRQWIRIVSDDGKAGAIQGWEIDFAEPLDVIEFDGRPMPMGKQKENWVIENNSCKKVDRCDKEVLDDVYKNYAYKKFWGNFKAYLDEAEFEAVTEPSESIMKVSNVRIYKTDRGKAKIDFTWTSPYPIKYVSMTDQDFYDKIHDGAEVLFDSAYIVVSIPKETDEWLVSGEWLKRAYKFVSKIYEIKSNASQESLPRVLSVGDQLVIRALAMTCPSKKS